MAAAALVVLRAHRWFLAAIALQLGASAVICGIAGRPMFSGVGTTMAAFIGTAAILGAMALAVAMLDARKRHDRTEPAITAYPRAWRVVRSAITREYLLSVLLAVLLAPVAMAAFSAAKQAIPTVQAFGVWDVRLARWDAALHGGRHPWEWLRATEWPQWAVVALDRWYHGGWSLTVLLAYTGGALLPLSSVRRQYLTATALAFAVIGTIAAALFASAGPAYYGRVVNAPDPYGSLVDMLRAIHHRVPLTAVRNHDVLWLARERSIDIFGVGISAMPSMHVAKITLAALVAWRLWRPLGVVMWALVALTVVGSVVFAWHYSLDGYVAGALALGIWWASGHLTASSQVAGVGDHGRTPALEDLAA